MALLQTISSEHDLYQDVHLVVDYRRRVAALDARQMQLTRKEYELLEVLVQNAGEIVPREALLMRIWGYSNEIRTRTLDVHIRRLRKKLGRLGSQYIETIFGIGYRFQSYRAPRFLRSSVATSIAAAG